MQSARQTSQGLAPNARNVLPFSRISNGFDRDELAFAFLPGRAGDCRNAAISRRPNDRVQHHRLVPSCPGVGIFRAGRHHRFRHRQDTIGAKNAHKARIRHVEKKSAPLAGTASRTFRQAAPG
jgi:hypothetical protein